MYHVRRWHQDGGVMIMGYDKFRLLANPNNKKLKERHRKLYKVAFMDPGTMIIFLLPSLKLYWVHHKKMMYVCVMQALIWWYVMKDMSWRMRRVSIFASWARLRHCDALFSLGHLCRTTWKSIIVWSSLWSQISWAQWRNSPTALWIQLRMGNIVIPRRLMWISWGAGPMSFMISSKAVSRWAIW